MRMQTIKKFTNKTLYCIPFYPLYSKAKYPTGSREQCPRLRRCPVSRWKHWTSVVWACPCQRNATLPTRLLTSSAFTTTLGTRTFPGCNSEVQGRNGMPILNTSQHCCCDSGYIALYSVVWVDWFHEILGYGWLPMVMALIVLVIVLVRWLVLNRSS